jgi:hypothetical protein
MHDRNTLAVRPENDAIAGLENETAELDHRWR